MSDINAIATMRWSSYPQRAWHRDGVLDAVAARAGGALRRAGRRLWPDVTRRRFVRLVSRMNIDAAALGDAELRQRVIEEGHRLRRSRALQGHTVASALALLREVAARKLGMRPYDTQLAGAYAMLGGAAIEMKTGEGKTLAAAIAATTAALAGVPVHVVTVNDYLAERDAADMMPLYAFLGLTVGVVRQGKTPEERHAAYDCDIVYCVNKEIAFDYLRDVIAIGSRSSELQLKCDRFLSRERGQRKTLLRGLFFAIVDEADSVLIDEARTPLVISRSASDPISNTTRAHALETARSLLRGRDYEFVPAQRRVELTPAGCSAVAAAPVPDDTIWDMPTVREELVQQALAALHLFRRDRDYVVQDGAVVIVDEHTGRLMPDRSWSAGLHQMVEIKEGCEPSAPTETLARMTYQRFFRRYCMLAGMSGTLREVAPELWSVYRLKVTPIPPHRRRRVRHRRTRICRTAERKWRLIAERTRLLHAKGVPVLIGTGSVEASLEASRALDALGLSHVVLNAEQSQKEAEIVVRAGLPGAITVATSMAGRGTDIKLGEGVKEIGGLHVIMSERYESRRVDRQLLGRCGRQGDPGHCELVLSLDDPLIRTWSPALSRGIRRLAPFVGSWPGRLVMRLSQRKAEAVHARMRRELLKLDRLQGTRLAFTGKQE